MVVNVKQLVGQFVGLVAIFALALFLPAGTLAWPAGWLFLLLFFSFFLAVNVWLFRHNPGLLRERMRFGTFDQKGWDKILFPLFLLCTLIWLMFMAIDAARFHSSNMPVWLQYAGAVIVLCSFYLLFLTFRENSYLSPVVRIQKERGQQVVSTGPYHYIRHPMYTGIAIFMVGTPLLLGSWYGILLGLLFVMLLARRAVLEERTLRSELQGYATYMTHVKYRLIPAIW